MHKNCISRWMCLDMSSMTSGFGIFRSSFVVYDRQYLDEKQREFLFLLFEVHITLGFKSEVSAFISESTAQEK